MQDIKLIPFKNIDSKINKYHIINEFNNQLKFIVNNVYAPYGYQNIKNQYRFNITDFKREKSNNIGAKNYSLRIINESFNDFINNIKLYEKYFSDFIELKDYKLNSNILKNKEHNIIIRCHLKTCKKVDSYNNIITSFKEYNNGIFEDKMWLDYNKSYRLNIICSFDSFWINHITKEYGISICVIIVKQFNNLKN